ncbi:MAG: sodium/proline symporter [Porticoccaceae bacterium]
MVTSFLFFLGLFLLVGISSALKSRHTKQDYYLASSGVHPVLVGLSAVATNNSGYMFIGVIGYTYTTGLAAVWLMVGWILGDVLVSGVVHRKLRQATEKTGQVSYPGVLSHWTGHRYVVLQRLIALIALVFLMAYAGAQLVAGSKALEVLLGWPSYWGALGGAALVVSYCLAGGIRASIWTDAAQSVVMMGAMLVLLWTAVAHLGGPNTTVEAMYLFDGFMDPFPKDVLVPGLLGGLLFAVSWGFAGLSVIGQPHVMVRFMALDNPANMRQARVWYYLWFTLFYAMATAVGMLSRVYFGDSGQFDAEVALPLMAQGLLNPIGVGLVLAGIFAATMSTADSLVLSCSAAITHDLLPHKIESTCVIKTFTLLVTVGALCWALFNQESVFSLVLLAWSGLASAFAPLLIVLCLGHRPSQVESIVAVMGGLCAALLWRYFGWQAYVYEGMAGILVGLGLLAIPCLLVSSRHQESA